MHLATLTLDGLRWGLVQLILLITSIGLHEFGHAWVADLRGDPLPRAQGRVTLDPFAHVDPIGTILIPAIGIFGLLPFGLIGWGKPVQVLLGNPRTRKWDDILITLAGPAMNLLQCLAFALLALALGGGSHLSKSTADVVELGIWMNASLMCFNLLPIPPLDGSRVMRWVVGMTEDTFRQVTRWSPLVLLLLINIPAVLNLLDLVIVSVAAPFFWLGGLPLAHG